MARLDPMYGSLPRILRAVFSEEDLFRCGLVVEKNEHGTEVLSEKLALAPNYINRIRTGFPRAQSNEDPKTLLYLLLRHSALLEQARSGLKILRERGLISKFDEYEKELNNIYSEESTIFEWLDRTVSGVTGRDTLSEYLLKPRTRSSTPEQKIVDDYRDALRHLEELPTAELERLLTETLDVCSYRLDAWITSLAKKRLDDMRDTHPEGTYVGAYGWVENLKPFPKDEEQPVEFPGHEGVRAFTHNGGYIYTPSMTHAAAAAVLRNAYMTRAGEQQSPYAINMSSARVRTALWLLDTVREGQPLGASLGYLFERGLHDHQLDRFINDFRNKYPLVANKITNSNEHAESIAARNVVDGYALIMDYAENKMRGWTDFDSPLAGYTDDLTKVVTSVEDALDALADLLTAESVYQMVGGSVEGAGASLDAMAKGAHPPEPEIARWPRGGTSLTHRVALILDDSVDDDNNWPVNPTPRGLIEPRLNNWVGRILGDPSKVKCRVTFPGHAGIIVSLKDLDLQPLDVLALAKGVMRSDPLDSELDHRVAYAASTIDAFATIDSPNIQYGDLQLDSTERTFLEILEVARAINNVLGDARAIKPQDLLLPEEAGNVESAGANQLHGQLIERASDALIHITDAKTDLDNALTALGNANTPANVNALRIALRKASLFGIPSAFPPFEEGDLIAFAKSVRAELVERYTRAVEHDKPVDKIQAVFGRDFLVLPHFHPAKASELEQALSHPPSLGDAPDMTISEWLAMAARVRKPLNKWRMVSLYRTALGQTPAMPKITQLPHQDPSRWVGLPFDNNQRPSAGRVSLMLFGDTLPNAQGEWAGILLDEWVELIPNAKEDAGVAFHYDRPGGEAPQAVLIAVPPDDSEPWSLELLIRILGQTFEIAKLRGFDGEYQTANGDTGHAFYGNPWLPMILMAENPEDATIATTFTNCMQDGA